MKKSVFFAVFSVLLCATEASAQAVVEQRLLGSQRASTAPPLTTEQRLAKVERQASRLSDYILEMNALKRENRELRGEIESLNYQISQLKRKQRDLYLDIDQRMMEMQNSIASAGQPATPGVTADPALATTATAAPVVEVTPPVDTKATPAKKPTSKVLTDPVAIEAEYKLAYSLLSPEQRRYKEAIVALQDFVAKYPEHSLASNAQYWLGEAYYVSQDNENALKAFRELEKIYPDSAKLPGALYKIGRILYITGDIPAAKQSLSKVLKQNPGTSAAGLSQQFLDRIKREGK